jgi:hypothetical protein
VKPNKCDHVPTDCQDVTWNALPLHGTQEGVHIHGILSSGEVVLTHLPLKMQRPLLHNQGMNPSMPPSFSSKGLAMLEQQRQW